MIYALQSQPSISIPMRRSRLIARIIGVIIGEICKSFLSGLVAK